MQWSSEIYPLSVYGCTNLESTKHLLWECLIAQYQWQLLLEGWNKLVLPSYRWTNVADVFDLKWKENLKHQDNVIKGIRVL